ncbi:hypothetical protein [Nocardia sp. NRRL S-836]|uniref:hypothetical protein n=1 Tax=Nocardia sp. NRRL S-836 TaxID=1519492 RepID=UPI0006B05120|nr:hypothetical protein [Nocardia sp. NRRL S-836]KOV88903.1 hypothetical protein ADL03_04470 [Nocardia sp. NRRL S-836]
MDTERLVGEHVRRAGEELGPAVNAELRKRLLLLNAGLLDSYGEEAVRLACDLLLAGAESLAVAELAGEPPTRLPASEAVPLVERMVAELGFTPLSDEQVVWVELRELALDILAGREQPGHWACCDVGRIAECWGADELRPLLSAAVGYDPGPVDPRVLELLREFVAVADRRLTGW